MLVAKSLALALSLATAALAAPTTTKNAKRCNSGDPTPVLPSTGGSSELPAPPSNVTLKYIAVGHGIQNYSCAAADNTTSPTQLGALAVLYDVTPLYPGTAGTGLSDADAFNNISVTVLYKQAIPLNLADPDAAGPGNSDSARPESDYGANTASPFIAPADLDVDSLKAKFLGHHYFDASSSPTFDLLDVADLKFSGAKSGDVKAPSTADKGILSTGAVDWLQLSDNKRGISQGVSYVYRVVTAGGAAQPCSVSGAGAGSVPYTAQYWFYG